MTRTIKYIKVSEAAKKVARERGREYYVRMAKDGAKKLGHEHFVNLGKITQTRYPNLSSETMKKTMKKYPHLKFNLIHTKEHTSKAGKIGGKRLHELYPKEFFVQVGRKGGLNSAVSRNLTSKEELIMGELLPNDFVQNQIFNGGVPDFRSDKRKIIVEVDGIYWHNKPKTKMRDKRQTECWLKKGYQVFRFTDKDVNEYMKPLLRGVV